MNRILLSSLVSAAVVLQPALAAAGLVQIGAAAGVKGRPMAVSEGQPAGHVIESGKPVYMNDHVTTDANSRMQVMLKDETVFTLGPSSDMILDEFVYDPATQNGKVTATVTKGVFRFVTGKIAGNQPSNMKVKLPVGTIGIRGTIVAGLVSGNMCAAMLAGPGAGNNANAKAGAFNLSNGAGSTEVKVSGEGSMITGGGAPTPAGPLPATVVGEINAGLAAKPASGSSDDGGGTGGSSEAKSGDGDGDSSASEQSGNSTAAGQESAGESAGTTEVAQALNDTATQGSQDNARLSAGIADGTATYDQLRSVNTGFTGWFFSGDSPISCGNCAGSAQGTLQLWVDFANHTLGGSGTFAQSQSGQNVSFVHLHNIYSVGDTVQRNIAAVDYFPLSGDAKYSPSFSGAVTCTAGCAGGESFAGTTIEIRNAGGVIAAQAVGNIQFASSTRSISATVTSPREGATAAP